jgi:hypothetical protein
MNILILIVTIMGLNLYASVEELSAVYLQKSKAEENVLEIRKKLASLSVRELSSALPDDSQKRAFWLNLYNGFVQETLRKNPQAYEDKNSFFSNEAFIFKDASLSLDDIEHGILRKSQFKYGMGYIKKWFVSDIEKKLRVEKTDWRIHFALNCGAASCPAIHFYKSEKIDKQLETATLGFLEQDILFDQKENEISLSKIFFWFKGDFEGANGIKKIISEKMNLKIDEDTKLIYKDYDWTIKLE